MTRFRGLTAAIAVLCLSISLLASPQLAEAQTATTYQLTDSANVVHQTHGFTCVSTLLCLAYVPIDYNGNPFGVSANPFYVNCTNCSGGGGGLSVAFAGAIGANGTPGGFKDGSGNFQSFLGDTTNGQWVFIKNSSIGVTGTFWPYTLGQQVAGSSVPVVLTAAQLATLTPPAALTNYAQETGGNLAQLSTDIGAPGSTACVSDTASCNANQQLQRLAQRLTSIVTALGSPFQAGSFVGIAGNSGTPTQSTVTVGTSSSQLIAASTFSIFEKVCVAQSAANGIWVNWAGAAAVQAAPSEYIPPGQCDSWVAATGYLPTSQVNAIASASVAATIIGK